MWKYGVERENVLTENLRFGELLLIYLRKSYLVFKLRDVQKRKEIFLMYSRFCSGMDIAIQRDFHAAMP